MTVELDKDIAEGVKRQDVDDDSELTSDDMLAAAALHFDDPEGWGAAGMDAWDDDHAEATP